MVIMKYQRDVVSRINHQIFYDFNAKMTCRLITKSIAWQIQIVINCLWNMNDTNSSFAPFFKFVCRKCSVITANGDHLINIQSQQRNNAIFKMLLILCRIRPAYPNIRTTAEMYAANIIN